MDGGVASSSGGEKGQGRGIEKGKGKGKGKGKREEQSVVFDAGIRHSSCGYCSSSSPSSVTHGLLAKSLTANDYQELLDRGWRRSGCYVYKPEMHKTCCPQYTIRLKASNFMPSKEQDRVLKKMQRYLNGDLHSKLDKSNEKSKLNLSKKEPNESTDSHLQNNKYLTSLAPINERLCETENQDRFISFLSDKINNAVNAFLKGRGIPLTDQYPKPGLKKVRPQMKRKLKDIIANEEDLVYTCNVSFQIAAYIKKLDLKVENLDSISPNIIAEELAASISSVTISGFIIKACNGHLNFYADAKKETVLVEKSAQAKQVLKTSNENTPQKRRKLEIQMKRSEFDPDEYALYEKYQKLVHQDKRISKESYIRFLVDTPIPFVEPDGSSMVPTCGFGSFHQQYSIDGRIIAVGVVDILPKCLSSKYLFWDPDFAFLSLGKYTALKEIQWVREMQTHCQTLEYYYLGYYIHTCNKMRYKAAYRPSELLCPLRYEWVPYDLAKPLLDRSKYVIPSDFKTTEVEHPGSSSTSGTHHENVEDYGDDEDSMHEDTGMGPDEDASSADMDDDETEDDLSGVDAETISDLVIEVQGKRVKYKDLQETFYIRKKFLSILEKQLYRYVKVVGKDLSSRMVYSLG